MAEDKTASPQPQSGADKDEKEGFRQLPEDKNEKEVGQDNKGLAPMLHWDVDTKSDDA